MGGPGSASAADAARQTGARRLRDAIDDYLATHKDGLNERALDLLARLANSTDAANAFIRLKLQGRQEAAILLTCIQADQLPQIFFQRIMEAESTLMRMERLDKAVADLHKFVMELFVQNPPASEDLLSARIREPPANIAAMKWGLELIADRIDAGARVAKEDALRLGATHKKGRTNAAARRTATQNAVIGWLAEGVCRVTNTPHPSDVANLANVILEIDTVTENRVRHAARLRKREWRQP